jgi:hypothetical protein
MEIGSVLPLLQHRHMSMLRNDDSEIMDVLISETDRY